MPLNRWAKFTLYCLTGALLLAGAGLFWIVSFVNQPVAPPAEALLQISPGTSFSRIAIDLEQAGVIGDARRFTLMARWHDATARIHAGEYLFQGPAKPGAVLDRLVAGDVRKRQLTIPEGFTLAEIAARVDQAGIAPAERFLALAGDAERIAGLGIEAGSLEGYLFPETYTFTGSTTAAALISAMVEQLRHHVTPALLAAAEQRGLSRHQLVTLASIIQKEAGNTGEMPLISAVFHNRLQRGIPLQADPTVIYGVPDFDGNLTRRHLLEDTPYNTYRRRGLPPGPIASPGAAALQAAAQPADVAYLYFVARGDGTHEFNATLSDHNRAVRRYQLRR